MFVHACSRIQENGVPPEGSISDARNEVLESIAREAAKKEAKSLAEATRREAIVADAKVHAQEETMRIVHQKQADRAMDVSGGTHNCTSKPLNKHTKGDTILCP